jgi:hypothetical protein
LAGNWQEDKMDGEGTYYYANGDIYAGSFSEGKKHGQGMYFFKVRSEGCKEQAADQHPKLNGASCCYCKHQC